MKRITYRITYREGHQETVTVSARNINSGFSKALKLALLPLGNGERREVVVLAFEQWAR